MHNIIATVALAAGLVLGTTTVATAQTPDFPATPACARPAVHGGDLTATWADAEADCSLAVTGDARDFVTFTEGLVDYFRAYGDHLAQQLVTSEHRAEVQQATIAHQRQVIARLRAKLARRH